MRTGVFQESYGELISLIRNPTQAYWTWALVIMSLAAPFVLSNHVTSLVNGMLITAIGVIGLNLLTGTTGLISFGQAGFLAVGGYTAAILSADYNMPLWLCLPAGALAAGAFGLLVGIPSLRLKGLYLAITTLAFTIIITHVILSAESITHGSSGISTPKPAIFGMVLDTDKSFYYLILAVLTLAVLGSANIKRSRIGRAFLAIREQDIAARAMGVPVARYKLYAFVVSSSYAGVAGALMVYHIRFVNVDSFSLVISIEAVSMIIVGGLGSTAGAVIGVVFVVGLAELLNYAFSSLGGTLGSLSALELKGFLYGLTIVLFLRFEPDGLMGIYREYKNRWVNWPFRY
ncbi:branched-chain amino acid ABC transporter permease [Mesorhizobium sp. J428]|uniref:branched-chain amino acid ABC transporter permease n=1 Tax=Mesorhizobium sp. J428 TaxID=2898440 RepID=UPI0021514773|nr:branched-chain amino acid ABC transporter permease [Mesorhizobium sp. J428]MCR5860258.1 branched-chain amino acid ABC transporter permease [Mesorhizobium sp. J428]MCR5860458.1 branched-chain amino acid ABC transporter permease [Mesorhizobium sp. J428]